jgi:TQXA domain-containing protein
MFTEIANGRTVHKAKKKGVIASIMLAICLALSMLPVSALAANPAGTYVGYLMSNGVESTTQGTSVPDIYVIDKSTYDKVSYDNSSTYLTYNDGSIAYCFNKSKYQPFNRDSGTYYQNSAGDYSVDSGRVLYNKYENVTSDQFKNAADNSLKTDAELRQWIMSIGMNGYPLDYSGFNVDASGKQILSNSAFRVITQLAIWRYTDSYDVTNDNPVWSKLTNSERALYYKLIDSLLPDSITTAAKSTLDLYLWDGNPAYTNAKAWDGYKKCWVTGQNDVENYQHGYQNLLVVSATAKQNLPAKRTLTISKAVEGSSTTQDFNFTAKLTNSEGATQTDHWFNTSASGAAVTSNPDGTITFTLKAGAWIEIELPAIDFEYVITETETENYTASYKTNGVEALDSNIATGKVTSDADTTVAFTNTYSPTPAPNQNTEGGEPDNPGTDPDDGDDNNTDPTPDPDPTPGTDPEPSDDDKDDLEVPDVPTIEDDEEGTPVDDDEPADEPSDPKDEETTENPDDKGTTPNDNNNNSKETKTADSSSASSSANDQASQKTTKETSVKTATSSNATVSSKATTSSAATTTAASTLPATGDSAMAIAACIAAGLTACASLLVASARARRKQR